MTATLAPPQSPNRSAAMLLELRWNAATRGRPGWLVVNVEYPATIELPVVIGITNRRSTSALRKSVLFWPWTIPAKLQYWRSTNTPECSSCDGFHAFRIRQVDGPAVRRGRQRHRSNSSMIRDVPLSAAAAAPTATEHPVER